MLKEDNNKLEIKFVSLKENVNFIFSKMPIMTVEQFKKYLEIVYTLFTIKLKKDSGMESLVERQMQYAIDCGYVFSDGEYVCTPRTYSIVFGRKLVYDPDGFKSSYEKSKSGNKLKLATRFVDAIKCFDVILDMYPASIDFIWREDVFPLSFVDSKKKKLVQICYFSNQDAISKNLNIKTNYSHIKESNQETISRIAVVESPELAEYIDNVGFRSIVYYDENGNRKLVEKRTENVWG